MVEELQIFAKLVDYPVTVLAFVWALRMIQNMNNEMVRMLERCLEDKYEGD